MGPSAEVLTELGADSNRTDSHGRTPLHAAASEGGGRLPAVARVGVCL